MHIKYYQASVQYRFYCNMIIETAVHALFQASAAKRVRTELF